MEIKNKKWAFALILLVLTLINSSIVSAQTRLNYLAPRLLLNYLMVFSLLFIIFYIVVLNKKENKPHGVTLGFFIAALFAISVVLVIGMTGGENVFLWQKIGSTAAWFFKIKTIINFLILIGIGIAAKTYFFKAESSERQGQIASWFIVILAALLLVSTVNYDFKAKQHVDRWIWDIEIVKGVGKFLLGGTEADEYGEYNVYAKDEAGKPTQQVIARKQAILRVGRNGAGLPAFFIGSLLLIYLFMHFEIFKDKSRFLQYGVPIFLAAILANEPGLTKIKAMGYAWWTALLIIRSSINKRIPDRPGTAFGLTYAIVETVYTAIVGRPYLSMFGVSPAGTSFLRNFIVGIGVGFLWDLLIGKGSIWDATAKRKERAIQDIHNRWERDGAVKTIGYGLGKAANVLGLTRVNRFKWMIHLIPLTERLKPMLKDAKKILEDLIAEEQKTGAARNPKLINQLRTNFNNQIQRIKALNKRIRDLRSIGGGP